eukprot:TRINITY_DN33708_c0_g1_i1.p1 TRINITY_DN33708_c0_g1~~TRINITY_DN33708_c0_g1_i1.p1  ORF type:complete len:1428 (+),score=197.79 TRINITY_DN33708_c0_g1_i1:369-4286(+)
MCANEGFVVTSSLDSYVRVWPLDFKEFYLHAKHESSVVGVDITADGMQVLCSTYDGSIGVLDMKSHAYQNLLRSHGAMVVDAAVSEFFSELATVCCDGMLKVWALPSMSQTYEFTVSEDQPQAVAFHPGDRHLIAVGFVSGTVRIFDADVPTLLSESRPHVRPICSIACVLSTPPMHPSAQLITCDSTGALTVLSEAQGFEVVRCPDSQICAPAPKGCNSLIGVAHRLLQYIDARSVALFALPDIELLRKLRVPSGSRISSLDFSSLGGFAVLGTTDSRLHVFEALGGRPAFTCSFTSGPVCAALLAEPPDRCMPMLLLTCMEDKLLRISQVSQPTRKREDPSDFGGRGIDVELVVDQEFEQSFVGHATSPHRIILSQGSVVTVSSREIVCWTLGGAAACFGSASGPQESLAAAQSMAIERPLQCSDIEPGRDQLLPMETTKAEQTLTSLVPCHANESCETGCAEQALALPSPCSVIDLPENIQIPETNSGNAQAEQALAQPLQIVTKQSETPEPEQAPTMTLRGVFGCSLHSQQSFAWQASPCILCHSIGAEVYVEDWSEAGSDGTSFRTLSLPSDDSSVIQAVDLDPLGVPRLAALFMIPNSTIMWLCLWDLKQPSEPILKESYCCQGLGNECALLCLLPGATGAITVTGRRVDVWHFEAVTMQLWASAEIGLQPKDILLLPGAGSEFAVLHPSGPVLWRCSPPPGTCFEQAGLQFQAAEAPSSWDGNLAGCLTCFSIARKLGESGQTILIMGSVGGYLWLHDVDNNQPLAQLHISVESCSSPLSAGAAEGLQALACIQWPIIVGGLGSRLQVLDLVDDMQRGVFHLDGPVRTIRTNGSLEHSGLASTAANTLWYFHVNNGNVVPLRTFHAAPSRSLCSNSQLLGSQASMVTGRKNDSEVLATCSEDGRIYIWTHRSEHSPKWFSTARLLGTEADGPCIAVCFLKQDLLACAFLGGYVLLFSTETLELAMRLHATMDGELLLGMQEVVQLPANSLVLVTSQGRILETNLETMEVIQLPGPPWRQEAIVCDTGMIGVATSEASSSRPAGHMLFAGSSAGELRIWQRGFGAKVRRSRCDFVPEKSALLMESFAPSSSSCTYPQYSSKTKTASQTIQAGPTQWYLVRSSLWPVDGESNPRRKQSAEQYLSVLASPPFVACFLSDTILVVYASGASSLSVYSYLNGSVLQRVELLPGLRPILRLRAWPLPHARFMLLVLGTDWLAGAHVFDVGRCWRWLQETWRLPGAENRQSTGPCRPDVCLISSWDQKPWKSDEVVQQRNGTARTCSFRVVLKSDVALSSWDVSS